MKYVLAFLLLLTLSGCLQSSEHSKLQDFQSLEAGYGMHATQLTPNTFIPSFRDDLASFASSLPSSSEYTPLKLWVEARIDMVDSQHALQTIQNLTLRLGSEQSCTNGFPELHSLYTTALEKNDAAVTKLSLLKENYSESYSLFIASSGIDIQKQLEKNANKFRLGKTALDAYC
jgi:hypothetical protein